MSYAQSSHLTRRRMIGGLVGLSSLALIGAGLGLAPEALSQDRKLDVPYVPTPQDVVDKMLEMAEVRPDDFLIDLGSGDGRIPITAAQRFGTRGYGVDLNPERVREARENARKAGVEDKVQFEVKDLFQTDISKADVLTLYLLPTVNRKLMPRILAELKPGTRVVSHEFDMGDWKPERTEKVGTRTIYKWTVPARVEGKWSLRRDGAGEIDLRISQDKASIRGSASIDGRQVQLRNAAVDGERIRFELAAGDGRTMRFEGRLVEGRLEGDGWQAVRAS